MLEEIKKQLDRVTSNGEKWDYDYENEVVYDRNEDYEYNRVVDDIDPVRGVFISKAPYNIRFLINEIENLQLELKVSNDMLKMSETIYEKLQQDNERLRKRDEDSNALLGSAKVAIDHLTMEIARYRKATDEAINILESDNNFKGIDYINYILSGLKQEDAWEKVKSGNE